MSDPEPNDDLVFHRATSDQITKHFENNGQVWAGPLAKRDYLELQYQLSDAEANHGNTGYWVLHHSDDPNTIISSCTTYVRDVIVAFSGQGSRTEKAMVVTDIVTHPEHRMKGMATLLLRKLQAMTDDWQAPKVQFSVIYGDLQTDFIERLGWKPYPAMQLRILIGKTKVEYHGSSPNPCVADQPEVLQFLEYSSLHEFTSIDINTSKLRLSGMRGQSTHVQFVPSPVLAKWHLIRTKLYKHHLVKEKSREIRYGAIFLNCLTRRGVWSWWTHDFRARKLYIGRIMATRHKGMEERIQEVLHAAAAEASYWGFREVVLWDAATQVQAGAKLLSKALGEGVKVVVEERTDKIPCLRWHRGEDKDVRWEERQYYGWI